MNCGFSLIDARPRRSFPTFRRLAGVAHGARVLCACGRKADFGGFPYG
jgi:hypothetical protein